MEKNLKNGNGNGKKIMLILVFGILIGTILGIYGARTIINNQNDDKNKVIEEQETIISTNEENVEDSSVEKIEENINILDEMSAEEDIAIETPFVDLYYPEKWDGLLRIEEREGDTYTVRFFAQIEEREEQHIFDIIFGKTEGILLGTLNETEIYMFYTELIFAENWSEEDKNTIYAMQEDVNHIIEMLQKEDGFTPAF